jgi:DNA-directed RNA polymerase subunit omega
MARITVEDCVKNVADRFELVAVASERAKELVNGAPAEVLRDGDKNTVVALREIAEQKITASQLKSNIIVALRANAPAAVPEEGKTDLEFIEKEIMSNVVADSESTAGLAKVSEDDLKAVA